MAKGDVALVAGLAGFLLGGVGVYLGAGAAKDAGELLAEVRNVQKSDEESFAGLGEKVTKLDAASKELTRRLNLLDAAPGSRGDRLKAIEDRIASLEVVRTPDPGPPATSGGKGAAGLGVADAAAFTELQAKVFNGTATTDEQAEFWAMLREKPEILAEIMKRLEKAVADSPRDNDARMKLSQAYLAKLFTVAGPEQGTWSMKAMDQYKKVLAEDPSHWEARYSLAFNYSQWPDFLNKRPDAIKEFETLRKLQEEATPDPKHADTYLQLRQLYLKDGKPDQANTVLEAGLRRFPDDEELKKARDGAK